MTVTTRASRGAALLEFLRFFGGSAVGLALDLGGYALLIRAGVAAGEANLVSAFVSVSAVYLLVTRYAFRVGATLRTYVLFVTWYGTSIITFSLVIAWMTTATPWPAIVCKIATVPVSFAINYWFGRRVLSRTRTAASLP